ncbi:hypothetical protein V1387_13275 [Allomuricauda taeanensis]|uniref:hypothetical protein n=1 Tax=Flagellimonas taeanensis TaxID=1005926 RepID=UPI002E7B208D|nr:hypothetical protein [Allomuricauda taeanensis]MEE1963661.1 hypothetical protein [Allomuricauda taeanensis]
MKKIAFSMALFLFAILAVSAQTVGEVKIKTLGPANLSYRKSPKKVMISDFQVNYQTALNLEDSKKGGKLWRGGLKGDAKASLTLVLDGLNPDDLQKLTDQLYQDYVEDLKSKGFEIAPIEELWNNKAYEKNREKRWELTAGQGPEKGKEFGIILTRPTTQKFVVPFRTMGKDAIPLAGFADYAGNTESRVVNQKTDFIFNKVVLVVNVFEDSQSEVSRTLNRHAGNARVKAETTFVISEESSIMFDMGHFVPRGGVEVTGVMERQKFDVAQTPDRDKLGTDWGVLRVWSVDHQEKSNFSIVKCDPEKYLQGAKKGLNAYLDAVVQKLADKAD